MAEKVQIQTKTDVESASNAKELQQKRRMRKLAIVTAFVVFLTVIILVFSQTVMSVKTPKLRIRSIDIEDLTISSSNTSFHMKFDAEIGVKNTNFGEFKFDESSITFFYRGNDDQIGDASVEKGKAKARSTKKMNVTTEVETANSNLANDVRSGFLTLTGQSKLSGKVHLMKVFKKKKTAEMNCTITVNLENKVVQDLRCK